MTSDHPSGAAARPRIVLIHALPQSLAPIREAFARLWPEAAAHDLLDSSLSTDLADAGGVLDQAMVDRFLALGRYAAATGPDGRRTAGILFTCSSFGPAIEAVQASLAIPVLKPNEAAFAEALARGRRVALLVTFAPALKPMLAEFAAMQQGRPDAVPVDGLIVPGALAALQAGERQRHDALIAEAAAGFGDAHTIVLGQFSMSGAAPDLRRRMPGATVITTPDSATARMRHLVEAAFRRTGPPRVP